MGSSRVHLHVPAQSAIAALVPFVEGHAGIEAFG